MIPGRSSLWPFLSGSSGSSSSACSVFGSRRTTRKRRAARARCSSRSSSGERSRPRRRRFFTALAVMVGAWSIGCAANVAVVRVDRPPLPNEAALEELELVCQPTDDPDRPCRPTRIRVEVCPHEADEGCKVRGGFEDLISELDVYDDYVADLRGEEVIE